MKKLLFLLLLSVFVSGAYAQIPNAGFENWTSMGPYDTPDHWGNLNQATAASGVFTVAMGTTAPASGLAFVKLTTKSVNGIVTPGIIVSGEIDTTTLRPVSGFAFSSKPEKLKGKWQFMGYGTDAATIAAWLTKWNAISQSRDTIATLTTTTTGMLHTWGSFSIPFEYRSSSVPDTAVILISSSGKAPVKNSFIWVDDLAFDGDAAAVGDKFLYTGLAIYPNPASTYIRINLFSSRDDLAKIILSDNIGNQVLDVSKEITYGSNQIMIDLDSGRIRSGLYFLRVKTTSGDITRKVIIRK